MDFRFSGRFTHNLDEKGRLALPSLFREELQNSQKPETLWSRPDEDGYVALYPHESWEKAMADIKAIPDMSQREAAIELYCWPAQKLTVDKAGRVLLPPEQRAEVGLAREVKLTGGIFKIQIWDPARLKNHLARHEARREEIKKLPLDL